MLESCALRPVSRCTFCVEVFRTHARNSSNATVPELSHLPLLEQEGRAQFEAVAAALRHALGGAATVHERMREALLAEGQTASSARKRSRGGGGAVDAAA